MSRVSIGYCYYFMLVSIYILYLWVFIDGDINVLCWPL